MMKKRKTSLALLLSAAMLAVFTVLSAGCGRTTAPDEAGAAPAAEEEATAAREVAEEAADESPTSTPSTRASSKTARSLDAAPAAPSRPSAEAVVHTVDAGTVLDIEFLDGVSSRSSQVGDSFRARVMEGVVADGAVIIPAGSLVKGSVLEATSLKKIGGTARLGLEFNQLELPSGEAVPIEAGFSEVGKSETKKDAATIAGATAGGAILGRLLSKKDKGKGTAIGAIVGGATGTAIAANTKGEEVEIPAGTRLEIQLSRPTRVTVMH